MWLCRGRNRQIHRYDMEVANPDHLALLNKGAEAWDDWRAAYPDVVPDLRGADFRGQRHIGVTKLSGVQLQGADLRGAHLASFDDTLDLRGADMTDMDARGAFFVNADCTDAILRRAFLTGANFGAAKFVRADLREADLRGQDLGHANFQGADLREAILMGSSFTRSTLRRGGSSYQSSGHSLIFVGGEDVMQSSDVVVSGADFTGADLSGANLRDANLTGSTFVRATMRGTDLRDANINLADLSEADLTGAKLQCAVLVDTKVRRTKFNGAFVYGISAWDLEFDQTEQSNLVVTPSDEPTITVDNLEVAQFVYLLVKNPKIRDVINTIGQKSVLILGRFTEERKNVVEAIRETLRQHGYLPIVFDFERSDNRDFTETVMTLAGMSRFIIADITKPRSVPLELQATIPNYMIPFVPVIQEGETAFAMFTDLWQKYRDWVLEPVAFDSIEALVQVFDKAVIQRANERLLLLQARKSEGLVVRNVKEFLG